MILYVDPHSPVPPYEQIRSQLVTMISSGVLPEGTRLPAIRQLSADLGLASGTVARSYRELELTGLISTRGRHGTFVERPPKLRRAEQTEELRDAANSFARRARQLGVATDDALLAVRSALDKVGN